MSDADRWNEWAGTLVAVRDITDALTADDERVPTLRRLRLHVQRARYAAQHRRVDATLTDTERRRYRWQLG